MSKSKKQIIVPITSEMCVTLNSPQSLQQYEGVITAGLQTFRDVGEALWQIKEQKLYKNTHTTFASYCTERWKITQQHAGRLIVASVVVKKIESVPNGSVSPQSENQARALAKSDDPADAWKSTQDLTGKEQPSAREIEEYLDLSAEEIIEVDVVEDITVESLSPDIAFLLETLDTFEMGEKDGVRKISVGTDIQTRERLESLYEKYGIGKANLVAEGLLVLESVLEQRG